MNASANNLYHTNNTDFFINREKELEKLIRLLDNTISGQGGLVLINGEAGSGKTMLVQRLFDYTQSKGIRVIRVKFSRESEFDPYKPFYDVLKKNSRKEVLKSAADANAELNGYPGHRSDNNRHGVNTESLYSLQSQNTIIKQAVVSRLKSQADSRPIMIILDDIHLASQTTWRFIHYLTEKIAENKILLIATLRQDGKRVVGKEIPVYSDVLYRMNRDGLLNRIRLERFTENEVRSFLYQMFKKTDFTTDFISVLNEISGGLPAQLKKTIDILIDEQVIYHKDGIWFNKPDLSNDAILKIIFRHVNSRSILKKLSSLSDRQIKILRYVCLLDHDFGYPLITRLTGYSNVIVLKELHSLEKQKYLINSRENTFRLKSHEVKAALLGQISSDQKNKLHEEIAEAIKALRLYDPVKRTYYLAFHYSRSKNRNAAFRYLIQAGEQALFRFAFTEARTFYEKALYLYQNADTEVEELQIIFTHTQLAWLDRVLGYYEQSLLHCEKALELYSDDAGEQTINAILMQESFTYFRLNNWDKAEAALKRCLANQHLMSTFEKSMAFYGFGNIYFELGKYDLARENYDKALQLSDEINSKPMKGLILNNYGALENVSGNPIKAIKHYSSCIPIFKELGDKFGLARVYLNIGITYADQGDWERGNEFYSSSLKLSDELGLKPLKSIAFLNRALALVNLNQVDAATEYNLKAKRILENLNDQLGLAEHYKINGIISQKKGDYKTAEENFFHAHDKYTTHNNILGCAETEFEMGLMYRKKGDAGASVSWFRKASEHFKKLGLTKKVRHIDKLIEQLMSLEKISVE